MELKSCKLTYNIQNPVILECIFEMIISTLDKTLVSKELLAEIQRIISLYSFAFVEFCLSEEDQEHFIKVVEIFCAENSAFLPHFHCIIQILYKEDVITDKNVLKWAQKAKESIEAYKDKP
jgi:hypothetical protein